jgi:peptidoglycan DL-endopeptidase CwlO
MMMTPTPRFAFAMSIAAALGCASPHASRRDADSEEQSRAPIGERAGVQADAVEAVLAAARATLGQAEPRLDGRPVPTDCSGYVRKLYTRAGVDLFSESEPSDNGVRAIARWIERHGLMHRDKVAAPGDLVFFDNSYDRNGDGRLNDRFTHVGLVEEVLPDGTTLIVHATNHGVVREPMNLLRPHDATDSEGHTINVPLRRKAAQDTPRMPRLISELFAGFGRVLQVGPGGA